MIETGSRFDAVVALGKNWRLPIDRTKPRIHLSLESKMTALAAVEMVKKGMADQIIFSTGKTAGRDVHGVEYPPEAEEMFDYSNRHSKEVEFPSEAVTLQTESFTTEGDAIEDLKILEKKKIGSFALLTIGFHARRSKREFKKHGAPPTESFASEQILRNRLKHHERFVVKYLWSLDHFILWAKERVIDVISTAPKGEDSLRWLAKRTRSRLETD